MTLRASRRRGQPLLVLTVIMLCWIGARAFVWHTERAGAAMIPPAVALSPARGRTASPRKSQSPAYGAEETMLAGTGVRPAWVGGSVPAHRPAPLSRRVPSDGKALRAVRQDPAATPESPSLAAAPAMETPPTSERPPSFLAPFAAPPVRTSAPAERRWSADAWLLLRSGGGAASAGPSFATYGASQAGAVLRYRLWPGNAHRPTGYARVSAALNGSGEREAALGVSVRPIAALPVFVAGEGRVSHLAGRTVVRPAVMAVTELPPIALPFDKRGGGRAEFYLQGGYVGGQGATPFIDGQLRIDRRIALAGPVEVRAGGGAWGGAQRGAGRLDLGPAITLQASRGPAAMRLGLDWRFRLMGDAEPASGPALTVSAGF